MKKFFGFIVLCFIFFVSSALYLTHYKPEEKPDMSKTNIVVAGDGYDAFLLQIATKQGFFTDQGLGVEFVPMSRPEALIAIEQGKADIALTSDYLLALRNFKPNRLVVLASLAKRYDDGVVSFVSHPIRTPEDFAGKKIGYIKGSTGEVFLNLLADQEKFDPESTGLVGFDDEKTMVESLMNGQVQGATLTGLSKQKILASGHSQLTDYRNQIGVYQSQIIAVTSKDLVRGNTKSVVKFLKALVAAEDYAEQHPKEANMIRADSLGLSVAQIESLQPLIQWTVSFDQDMPTVVTRVGLWIYQHNLDAKKSDPNAVPAPKKHHGKVVSDLPEFAHLFVSKYLREVDSMRVSVP